MGNIDKDNALEIIAKSDEMGIESALKLELSSMPLRTKSSCIFCIILLYDFNLKNTPLDTSLKKHKLIKIAQSFIVIFSRVLEGCTSTAMRSALPVLVAFSHAGNTSCIFQSGSQDMETLCRRRHCLHT